MRAVIASKERLAALGTLVAGTAHEINNPLAAVISGQGVALEVLQELQESLARRLPFDPTEASRLVEDAVEALGDAQESGARIAQIIKDMAIFSSPDPKRTRARLVDVVDAAIRWLPPSVRTGASIQVKEEDAPEVLVSAGQITQVVVNLVTNAAKAARPGMPGEVFIRVGSGAPGMARLDVVDHGVGIDPAIRERIFDPFFTTRPVGEGKGSGLGLAVSRSIVTAHGGTLTVESEVGKSSTFRMELPAAPLEA
jgi:signal transduction histidine kinase